MAVPATKGQGIARRPFSDSSPMLEIVRFCLLLYLQGPLRTPMERNLKVVNIRRIKLSKPIGHLKEPAPGALPARGGRGGPVGAADPRGICRRLLLRGSFGGEAQELRGSGELRKPRPLGRDVRAESLVSHVCSLSVQGWSQRRGRQQQGRASF